MHIFFQAPEALEKQAPPNFPELYFDFQQVYERFHDFLLFDRLIGKNIIALGGGFSSGKSSFLNSLLGKLVLPANIDPSTSVPTYVIYGDEESAFGINEFDVKLPLSFTDIKSIAYAGSERFSYGTLLLHSGKVIRDVNENKYRRTGCRSQRSFSS